MCVVVTYNIGLDTVDGGVVLGDSKAGVYLLALALVLVMDHLSDCQNTSLLEGPGGQLVCEFAVGRLDGLATEFRVLRKPLVLEQLSRSDNHQARGVVGLHRRDEVQLLTSRKGIFYTIRLVLGAVAVCGAWGTKNGR
jgi:hypothetical protein